MTEQNRAETADSALSSGSATSAVSADAAAAPTVAEPTAAYAGLDGAASFADAESREIMNLLGDGGSCCGGSCCAA
ncbi:hypothetical protein [Leucobacter chromiiresistens]|uniref:Uncharacterized protein n=1 Tax=Leucobacter chromiiresistens TaxID=1079994 RepID=A0A1H0ZGM5_9MICO|nr:hypothetical protein [Leucobacter chromiiresistens]SDQ26479.1 hypothetical protein SAMN04488565_1734 [Leucobacter chromiiresistens]